MAITFVGSKSQIGYWPSTGSFTVTLSGLSYGSASSPAPGDLVLVLSGSAAASNTNPGIVSPTNTEVADLYVGFTFPLNLSVSYFICGATPPSSITVRADNGVLNVAHIQVWRGVDQVTPIDVLFSGLIQTQQALADRTGINCPVVTPVTNGATVVTGVLASASNTTVTSFFTSPSYTYDSSSSYFSNEPVEGLAWAMSYISNRPAGVAVTQNYYLELIPNTTGTPSVPRQPGSSIASFTLALRPSTALGNIKAWNGSSWTAKPVKYWNGTSWVTKPVKRWNGTTWITTNY